MKNLLAAAAAVVLVTALSSSALEPECRAPGGAFDLSFPKTFAVPSGERIVGFELVVAAADVIGMGRIPKGWSMKLDSEKAARKISGFTQQEKAAIPAVAELPTFTIAVNAATPAEPVLTLDGIVYTTADGKTYVRHRFSCSQLIPGG
jgi:hypothetical protein